MALAQLMFYASFFGTVMYVNSAVEPCKGGNANVNWIVTYKLPGGTLSTFLTSTAPAAWANEDLNAGASSYNTLLALYFNAKATYNIISYSDFPPFYRSATSCANPTKGVIAWTDNDGWWIVHTIPQWPDLRANAYAPPPAQGAGLIVCVVIPQASYSSLGEAINYQEPQVYYFQTTAGALGLNNIPGMKLITTGPPPSTAPYVNQYRFTSSAGVSATVASKLSIANTDIYSQFMNLLFNTSLVVWSQQTSRNPLLPSACNGKYKVENVNPTRITVNNNAITREDDTASWAIAKVSNGNAASLFCVSNADRTKGGTQRASSALCIGVAALQTAFNAIAGTAGIQACPTTG